MSELRGTVGNPGTVAPASVVAGGAASLAGLAGGDLPAASAGGGAPTDGTPLASPAGGMAVAAPADRTPPGSSAGGASAADVAAAGPRASGVTVLGLPTPSRPSAGSLAVRASDSSAPADLPAGRTLVDRFGRVATDLRVSLTDRCNLRCTYCMPEEGLAWLPRQQQLTDDEVNRLIRIAVERLGVTEVRFTGGEPLLRRGLLGIIQAAAALHPRPRLSITTNGIGLDRLAAPLRDAGLDRVNVSLDTVDPVRFQALTRRDRHGDVLAGLRAAAAAGLTPVKINTVLMQGINDDEAPALLRFALEHGYELRFIEQMPLDAQHRWDRHTMVTADDILRSLDGFGLEPDPVSRGTAPAETWRVPGHVGVDGGPARVGIIGSVTRPFCGDCDRTRLTADGQVRNCLFATDESDLRGLLRSGRSDGEVATAWRVAMWGKKPGHGIDDPTFLQPDRPMSAIGG